MEDIMKLYNGSYEQLEFDEGSNINVSLDKSQRTFPLHWHSAAEIIMPTEGTYTVDVSGKTYNLKTGDILFISIGKLHEIKKPSEGSRMVIQFDYSLIHNLKDFNASMTLLQSIKLISKETAPDIHHQIMQLMYAINTEYQNHINFHNAIMFAYLVQIYVLIARKYVNTTTLFSDTRSNKQQEYLSKFSQVFAYINKHYTQEVNLETLASLAGFSKFHFSRLFKQYTTMTLNDFINQKRMSEAEKLLLDPHLSITEVSLQSGFNSLSTFNRVFKSTKNCTPTEFKLLYNSHEKKWTM